MRAVVASVVIVCSATFALASGTADVHADKQVEDARAKARRLFNEGIDLRAEGKHLEALARFRAADDLVSTPKTKLELGRELLLLERFVEASMTLGAVASVPFDPKEAAKYAPTQKEAALLASEAARHVSRIHLVVSAEVRGLTIDGRGVLATAGDFQVDPGRHELRATVNDAPWRASIETEAGKTADVVVAGDGASDTPKSTTHGPPTLAVALLIGGGVGIVSGVALALSAKSTYADSQPYCGIGGDPDACNDEGLRLRQSAGTRADISTGLLVAGAGLAVGGAVVWWLSPKETGTPGATAGIRIGPGAVSLEGRF